MRRLLDDASAFQAASAVDFVSAIAIPDGPIIIPEELRAKAAAAGGRRGLESTPPSSAPPAEAPAAAPWAAPAPELAPATAPAPAAGALAPLATAESSARHDGGAGGGAGKAVAVALGTECAGLGWHVEQVDTASALPLLPADLFAAQLAARRQRRSAK